MLINGHAELAHTIFVIFWFTLNFPIASLIALEQRRPGLEEAGLSRYLTTDRDPMCPYHIRMEDDLFHHMSCFRQ